MIVMPRFQGFIRTFILICTGVFVLQMFAQIAPAEARGDLHDQLIRFFGLTPELVFKGMIFQPLTWIFLHANLMHLLFNMLGLWMFGSLLEEVWGSRRMAIFIFTSGICTGILVCLFGLFDATTFVVPTIGASGVIFATLMAISRLFPDQVVLFLFIFPMRMRYFAYLMVAIEFYALWNSNSHGVSNISHLAGALVGFVYVSFSGSGRGFGGGGHWLQRFRDQWRQRKMRKKIRIVHIQSDKNNRTTYH